MPRLMIPSPHPAARPLTLLAVTFFALGSGMAALPAKAQKTSEPASEQQQCLGEVAAGVDKRIEACSSLIGKSGARKDDLIGLYLARGDAQREKRELQSAIDDYGQVLKLDGGHLGALNRRGLAYAAKGDRERALADFDRAIKAHPKDAASYNNRGSIWRDRGAPDRALADFEKAIQLDPNFAPAHDNRGLA